MTRPLDGILVVSLEQAIAAPYCTRLLADLGARVIKVERPDGGDFARGYDNRARGLASHFVWCNRSKESLALDLKVPGNVDMLTKLIGRADVLVQNLAPGAADRLGIGADAMRAANPRLITCNISGYGSGGPWSDRKAYDLLIQAEAGFLTITGTPDQVVKSGLSIADISTGVAAHGAIMGALIRRHTTGKGDAMEISMLEAMCEWMGYPLYFSMDGAAPPSRAGAGHATIYPYGPYSVSDGTVLFGLQNDREWASFANVVLQRPDMASNPEFSGNAGRVLHRETIEPVIVRTFNSMSIQEATRRLDQAEIATARVNDLNLVWTHPQISARDRWVEIESPVGVLPALLPPSGSWNPKMGAVPALGEHTQNIIREFGLA
jgi:itaconate CoA-transferase